MLLFDLVVLWVAALAVGLFFRDIPFGRWCYRVVVEAPAAWFGRAGLVKGVFGLVIAVLLIALIVSAPEIAPFILSDFVFFIDLVIATSIGTAMAPWRRIHIWSRSAIYSARTMTRRVGRERAGSARVRIRRSKRPKTPDPEPAVRHWMLQAC